MFMVQQELLSIVETLMIDPQIRKSVSKITFIGSLLRTQSIHFSKLIHEVRSSGHYDRRHSSQRLEMYNNLYIKWVHSKSLQKVASILLLFVGTRGHKSKNIMFHDEELVHSLVFLSEIGEDKFSRLRSLAVFSLI